MSKIFDALRKAEISRGTQRKRSVRKESERIDLAQNREHDFLIGIDKDFRRSLLNLRNSIDSEMRSRDSRVIMFTSAIKGEGKTTIAAYLARVMSINETGRILVIDCATRKPGISALFGVDNGDGIIDYLSGRSELKKIIKTVDEGVMDVVTLGTNVEPDAAQPLFNSERMKNFLRGASEEYDYVIIDTSAILEAPETQIIGSLADATVMVVQAAKTKREVIKRAMMMVEKLNGKFIGTVLNRKKYYIPEFIYRRV